MVYNSAAENFRKMILSAPYSYIQSVNKDVKLNVCGIVKIMAYSDSRELMKSIDYLYYIKKS